MFVLDDRASSKMASLGGEQHSDSVSMRYVTSRVSIRQRGYILGGAYYS